MPITLDGTNGITTPMYSGAISANAVTPSVNMKSRIINGNMVIDQRNAGASVSIDGGASYTLDRYLCQDNTDGSYTVQQSSTAPVGFNKSMLVTITGTDSSLTTTQFGRIVQRIEGSNVSDLAWGTADAKTVTLSFWVRSSVTGTYSGTINNSDGNRYYGFAYTISSANTWEYKTITIVGDTTGTWLTTTGTGIELNLSIGAGPDRTITAGSWQTSTAYATTGQTNLFATNGATFYITGVQLEVGSTATSFDYRPYGTELALCQRYFEMSFPQGTAPVNGATNGVRTTSSVINTSNAYANNIMYVVQKRATPTVTTYNTDNCSAAGQAGYFKAGAWNNGNTTSTFGSMTTLGYNFGGTFTLLGAYYTDLHWTASAEL